MMKTSSQAIEYIDEPLVEVGKSQAVDDPRDGLSLFGPLVNSPEYTIRAGVIGTRSAIEAFRDWVCRIQGPILNGEDSVSRPSFPGFEAAFNVKWPAEPLIAVELDSAHIEHILKQTRRSDRITTLVNLYRDRILEARRTQERDVSVWFVLVSGKLKKMALPRSSDEPQSRHVRGQHSRMRPFATINQLDLQLSEMKETEEFSDHFHNQLKARLLPKEIVTQLIVEETLLPPDRRSKLQFVIDSYRKQQSQIAWNLASAVYYKHGALPWRLSGVRDGVCYVGMVFNNTLSGREGEACCAAQMFLGSGDGMVFRGAVGPWYTKRRGEFHLDPRSSEKILGMVIDNYTKLNGTPPKEVVIHGKCRFNDREWEGFRSAAGCNTSIVGVRVRIASNFNLFTLRNSSVLRGTLLRMTESSGYLMTMGFVPRLRTQLCLEVPRPLYLDVSHGECEFGVVARDILGLTKLNYNACTYATGSPVTLRFADAVGKILVSTLTEDIPPLPFKHYI
ncbi:MAG TPA: hypothetical protein VGL38_07340 [bacterium]|jgi:hypothetical protein